MKVYEEYQFGAWRKCLKTAPLRASGGIYGGGTESIVTDDKMTSWDGTDISPTLTAHNAGGNQRMPDKGNFTCVTNGKYAVRRLTPIECERLQALPDNYTYLPGEKSCSDAARYKALGNGMCQSCADFVIRRIVEEVNAQGEES